MSRMCLLSLVALLACARAYEDRQGKAAGIANDETTATVVTGELGNPLYVHCLESQYPTLFVFWYRGHGRAKLLYNDSEYGIRGNVLLIRNLTTETLGKYTCQPYKADDMVAARMIVVRANKTEEFYITSKITTMTTSETLEQFSTAVSQEVPASEPPRNFPALAWLEGPRGECSKRCGSGGVQSREVTCQKITANGMKSVVSDKECFVLLGPKPEVFQTCNEDATCPTWSVGEWRPCDRVCDEGKQTRQVICYQKKNSSIKLLGDENCTEEKPEEEQPCMVLPCVGVMWVTSRWFECDSCTSKFRTRMVVCATKDRQVVNERFCSHIDNRPADREKCHNDVLPACNVQWYPTQWSNCSVSCGDGEQTRNVFCGMYHKDETGERVDVIEDAKCANLTKYNDTKPCTVPKEECPAEWFAAHWSKCTETCGGGEQYRRVICIRGDQEAVDCDITTVPDSTQLCNTGPCDTGMSSLTLAEEAQT